MARSTFGYVVSCKYSSPTACGDCSSVIVLEIDSQLKGGIMLRGSLIIVGLLFVSVTVFAGTYLMNDTGKIVYGLRVTFSEPVNITSFGDALTEVAPSGGSKSFLFSSGKVAPSDGQWFNWEPTGATLLSYQWLESLSTSKELHGSCAYVDTSYGIPIVVTSMTERDLRGAGITIGDEIALTVGKKSLRIPLDYPPSNVPEGGTLAYLLWGNLRIYTRGGDFPSDFGVTGGTQISVRLSEKGKYKRSPIVADFKRYWSDSWIEIAQSIPPLEGAYSSLSPLHVSGNQILNAAGEEVILRGAAVPIAEEPVLKRDLLYLKSVGGNVVHVMVLPKSWEEMGGEKFIKNQIDNVVKWSGELGLYVIISWKAHGDPETRQVANENYNPDMDLALNGVSLLAHRYSKCSWVMYSVFNEPGAFVRWERFKICMTALVDAIHEENPSALVIVPGVNIAADLTSIPTDPIERENIVYATDVYPWVWDKTAWREDAQALLAAGFPLIVFEWGFDIPEDKGRFSESCQFATAESFGSPLLEFCEKNRMSWTAWVWTDDWCPHMFYDDERHHPTPFGRVVLETLHGGPLSVPAHATISVSVIPAAARADGCRAFNTLNGEYGDIPITIVQAEPGAGWVFDHWEGTFENSSWMLNSASLGADVHAIFKPLQAEADSIGSSGTVAVADGRGTLTSEPTQKIVVDDLKDGDFVNNLSNGWATYTESEYKLSKKWHFLSGDENAAMSLRSRHVSASITSFNGDNCIAWSFDGFGWVQLRTWLGFPKDLDGSSYDGVYLVIRAAQKIDLRISVDYRQVEEGPYTEWELRSASVPIHLPRGTVAKVLVPFSDMKLERMFP